MTAAAALSAPAAAYLAMLRELGAPVVPERDPETLRALQELMCRGLVQKVTAIRLAETAQ